LFYTLILENEAGQKIGLSKTANRYMFSKIKGLDPPTGTISTSNYAGMNGQLDNTNSKIKQLANAKFDKIGKLGSTLTKSVTLPILGAVTALTAFSVKAAYTADEIGDTAQKLGLSAEQFQEWNHVATIMGTSTESMSKAFMKVNGIMGDIATGNGDKVADSLALIGLTVDDLKGKNTDQAFELIRSALSEVADESVRVGVANEFFGGQGGQND